MLKKMFVHVSKQILSLLLQWNMQLVVQSQATSLRLENLISAGTSIVHFFSICMTITQHKFQMKPLAKVRPNIWSSSKKIMDILNF